MTAHAWFRDHAPCTTALTTVWRLIGASLEAANNLGRMLRSDPGKSYEGGKRETFKEKIRYSHQVVICRNEKES